MVPVEAFKPKRFDKFFKPKVPTTSAVIKGKATPSFAHRLNLKNKVDRKDGGELGG